MIAELLFYIFIRNGSVEVQSRTVCYAGVVDRDTTVLTQQVMPLSSYFLVCYIVFVSPNETAKDIHSSFSFRRDKKCMKSTCSENLDNPFRLSHISLQFEWL